MSTQEPDMNPYESPPQQGMRSSTKLLLGLGIGCGLVVLLCCGGFVATTYFAGSWLNKSASTDPGTVNNVAATIAQLDLPDEFQPTMSMDLKIPFSDASMMIWAMYEDKESHSMAVLAAGKLVNVADPNQIRVQLQQSLASQGAHEEQLRQTQMTEKMVTVRGQACKFAVIKGTAEDSKKERIQVVGLFPGKTGQSAIFIQADAKKYPEPRIDKILQSIQ